MKKYKGRKKYNETEASKIIESTMQLYYVNLENIQYWQYFPETKTDKLIQALTGESKEETIKKVEEQNEYLISKYEYFKKFVPENYVLKGSFSALF